MGPRDVMNQTHGFHYESKNRSDKDALHHDGWISDGAADSPYYDSDMENPHRRDRKRVGFTPETTPSSPTTPGHQDNFSEDSRPLIGPKSNSSDTLIQHSLLPLPPTIPDEAHSTYISTVAAIQDVTNVSRPKPAIRHSNYLFPANEAAIDLVDVPLDREGTEKARSGNQARQRAQKLAESVGHYGSHSAPGSRRGSFELHNPFKRSGDTTPHNSPAEHVIEMDDMSEAPSEEDDEEDRESQGLSRSPSSHTRHMGSRYHALGIPSGIRTPLHVQQTMEDYVPEPPKYRTGILGSLLRLHQSGWDWPHSESSGDASRRHSSASTVVHSPEDFETPQHSPPASGRSTPTSTSRDGLLKHVPKKWNASSLSQRWGSASSLLDPNCGPDRAELSRKLTKAQKSSRPNPGKKSKSAQAISTALHRLSKPGSPFEEQAKIERHIKDVMSRKTYLVNICQALMTYGAPTHRLEEYLTMSARVLQIESQFLYFPGFMIISFDDSSTHTTEVKLVRSAQGVSLGKLRDTHQIYKEVVHDIIDVDEATTRLKEVTERKDKYGPWTLVLMYGLASASVGPFAFSARWIDLPVCFGLGCLVGFLQHVLSRISGSYAHVFEITAAMLTSFLARWLGSIGNGHGGRLFCFSALAQSSIALILPGYTVLCAALELLSRSMVAGSVRMVYAIIYSLFLGFSITIGTALYGAVDKNATSATTCDASLPEAVQFPFVLAFTLCLIVVNQGKWKQMPVMMFISFTGYLVTYFSSSRYFKGNSQISNMLGALLIGLEANLYSRLGQRFENTTRSLWETRIRPLVKHEDAASYAKRKSRPSSSSDRRKKHSYGLAAAAMLPAIFVQVPSGLSVSGSLVSGVTSADQIVHNGTTAATAATSSSAGAMMSTGVAFNVSYAVIQVAIGITVGLALAAAMVYPFGKRRSGLFSF